MAGPSRRSASMEIEITAMEAVDEVVTKIEERKKKQPKQPTIWKIPSKMRNGLEDAYEPQLISIGPFHQKKEDLAPTEELKLTCVTELLARNEPNVLKDCAIDIAKCEKEVRQEYSEDINLSSKDFVELLLIDGCFLVELLHKFAERVVGIHLTANKWNWLRNDLLLMENQIPWFVLDIIFNSTRYDMENEKTLLDLTLGFLRKSPMDRYKHSLEVYCQGGNRKVHHLLHLSYLCLLFDLETEDTWTSPRPQTLKKIRDCLSWVPIAFLYFIVSLFELCILWKLPGWYASRSHKGSTLGKVGIPATIPTATELKDAGIQFKTKENASCPLAVSYHDGTLEIARIIIDDCFKSVFLNLKQLEQNCLNVMGIVTGYLLFMDCLINTADDVALLKSAGVIESFLGTDQDIAHILNASGLGVAFDSDGHYLVDVFKKVNDHCKMDHNRWRAKLMQEYFSNPWAIFSVLAAIILLVLTAIQAAYSIKSFNQDKAQNA